MEKNRTRTELLKSVLVASFGLVLFGFGVYLTIQANLGAAPWDVFCLGVSETIGIKYGTASISVSLVILLVDVLLGEKIGIGMILDAVIIGKTVDLCNYLNIVPTQKIFILKLLTIVAGMFVLGFSQFIYMRTALGCGPRDTLLVGLKRKMLGIPIGLISLVLLAVVTFVGWILGGPVGIGTLICVGLEGNIMQLCFTLLHFDPTDVKHQMLLDSTRILFGNVKESGNYDNQY